MFANIEERLLAIAFGIFVLFASATILLGIFSLGHRIHNTRQGDCIPVKCAILYPHSNAPEGGNCAVLKITLVFPLDEQTNVTGVFQDKVSDHCEDQEALDWCQQIMTQGHVHCYYYNGRLSLDKTDFYDWTIVGLVFLGGFTIMFGACFYVFCKQRVERYVYYGIPLAMPRTPREALPLRVNGGP
jgi:hypothetical protein